MDKKFAREFVKDSMFRFSISSAILELDQHRASIKVFKIYQQNNPFFHDCKCFISIKTYEILCINEKIEYEDIMTTLAVFTTTLIEYINSFTQ